MPASPTSLRIVRRPPLEGRIPDGRRVVLVHGVMDRATSFARLMAKLPEWTILAYDRRGYARSHHLGPPESFDQHVQDLVEVVGDEPAVAFGHSLGGDVVLAAASHDPHLFRAAVVWEAPQPWLPWWPSHSASRGAGADLDPPDRAEWFMRRMVGDRIWERLPAATREARRAEGTTLEAEMSCLAAGPVFDPTRIRIPVVVGRGGKSSAHQRRGARELASALPCGELADIADAGHGAHLTHPAELADLLRKVEAEAG